MKEQDVSLTLLGVPYFTVHCVCALLHRSWGGTNACKCIYHTDKMLTVAMMTFAMMKLFLEIQRGFKLKCIYGMYESRGVLSEGIFRELMVTSWVWI